MSDIQVDKGCHVVQPQVESKWIEVVWKREYDSEYCSVNHEGKQSLAEYGMEVTFNEKGVTINGESMTAPWKTC